MSHNDTNQAPSTEKSVDSPKVETSTSVAEVKKTEPITKPQTTSPDKSVTTIKKTVDISTPSEPVVTKSSSEANAEDTPTTLPEVSVPAQTIQPGNPTALAKARAKYKLKTSVTRTVNNQDIPKFAYRNTYSLKHVLHDRIIIKAGLTYTLAVKDTDVTMI